MTSSLSSSSSLGVAASGGDDGGGDANVRQPADYLKCRCSRISATIISLAILWQLSLAFSDVTATRREAKGENSWTHRSSTLWLNREWVKSNARACIKISNVRVSSEVKEGNLSKK